MKFSEIPYYRLNIKKLEQEWADALGQIEKADSFEEFYYAALALEHPQRMFKSMSTISEIRHTMNTMDENYREEDRSFARRRLRLASPSTPSR